MPSLFLFFVNVGGLITGWCYLDAADDDVVRLSVTPSRERWIPLTIPKDSKTQSTDIIRVKRGDGR